ncbi:MAG: hypothetical protein AAF327_05520 [Cyanobacteria bacterium P01_A01_bin.37]
MNISHTPEPNAQAPTAGDVLLLDSLIGVTIFDLNGLPQEYYGTVDGDDTRWIQIVFQAMGLQLLLGTAFQVSGFRHAIIHDASHPVAVFKLRTCCVAFLINPANFHDVTAWLVAQIDNVNLSDLLADQRFSVVVKS